MGCNARLPKNELLRIVRTPEGEVALDLTGKKSGRGVYICKDPVCFGKVRKSDRLSKSLEVKIPDEVYAQIEKQLKGEDE